MKNIIPVAADGSTLEYSPVSAAAAAAQFPVDLGSK